MNKEKEALLLAELLRVKYIKLHFRIQMMEDTMLPIHKASALRGGMGEMLLRINCIRNRNCENCEFEQECIVRRVMYSKMRIQPVFMSSGDSVGYVINCENYKEFFHEGDIVDFDLILFGRMVVYFGQILQAFQYLGYFGMGKNCSHFRIVDIANSRRERIKNGNDVYLDRLNPMSIGDYVTYRKRNVENMGKLVFYTPLALKVQGEYLEKFDISAIIRAIERRLYMLNCYEGIETERRDFTGHIPEQIGQRAEKYSVQRYSNRQDQMIRLDGICGDLTIRNIEKQIQELLLAGELIHIGKNTSFGFGRYRMIRETELE